jgi:transcriptional regulator with XRE-family HTH domain
VDEDTQRRRTEREKRYAELVGERLRKLRLDRGLSLQEVCERSGGSFVVSTLSAYERGKRSLSLERLYELATIYGVSPTSILDVEDEPEFQRVLAKATPLRIRLRQLDRLSPEERRPLETYLAFLRELRGDPSQDLLTVRKDDLTYISGLYGMRPQALRDFLEREGVLVTQ